MTQNQAIQIAFDNLIRLTNRLELSTSGRSFEFKIVPDPTHPHSGQTIIQNNLQTLELSAQPRLSLRQPKNPQWDYTITTIGYSGHSHDSPPPDIETSRPRSLEASSQIFLSTLCAHAIQSLPLEFFAPKH